MTKDEDVRLWSALSEVFVDHDVDYADLARRVAGFERSRVKEAFFAEVAPVCAVNLLAPVPPVWTAFDSRWLAETIERARAARRSSAFRRLCHRGLVIYLRYRLREEWRCIERNL